MVLVGKQVPSMLTSERFMPTTVLKTPINRKWYAASISIDMAKPAAMTHRQIQGKRRKKQTDITGPNQKSNSPG